MTNKKRFLIIQTQIGWIAAEVVKELEDRVYVEMGEGNLQEVLNEEIMYDEETKTENVLWW